MIVIGGSYNETVLFPSATTELVGSGVRAASTLGADAQRLVTFATPGEAGLIRSTVHADTTVEAIKRDQSIEFRYLDPSFAPLVSGLQTGPLDPLPSEFQDEDVLAFGFAELPSGYPITARNIVIDPQSPVGASETLLNGVYANRIAICANQSEARLMTGSASPVDAAEALLARSQVESVVVKCGPLGYITADSSGVTRAHATPTLTVSTLGSGDIFSSIFAREWFAGKTTADAAAVASAAVAASAGKPDIGDSKIALPMNPGYAPRVYLAGPFFTLSERWLVERTRAMLIALGARVFSPIHDVGPGDTEVAQKDLDGLGDCDVVLALLDGFDPGTIYEIGWAARENIPVIGFSSEAHPKETKMLVGMGAEVHTDLTSALFRSVWAGQGLLLAPGTHNAR